MNIVHGVCDIVHGVCEYKLSCVTFPTHKWGEYMYVNATRMREKMRLYMLSVLCLEWAIIITIG